MKVVHGALAPLVVALVVACGGTTSGVSSDGGLDGASDGGCVTPAQGAACTTDQSTCSTGGDACCIGYMWSCVSSAGGYTWQKLGLGCPCRAPVDGGADAARRDAGPIVCGGKTCAANEYCKTASGGAQPPDGGSNISYSCNPSPAACFAAPTCDCLKANGAGGCMCNEVDGWPSVTCNYP